MIVCLSGVESGTPRVTHFAFLKAKAVNTQAYSIHAKRDSVCGLA